MEHTSRLRVSPHAQIIVSDGEFLVNVREKKNATQIFRRVFFEMHTLLYGIPAIPVSLMFTNNVHVIHRRYENPMHKAYALFSAGLLY